MIIIITYKTGIVEKVETDKLRIVGGSSAYLGEEERQIKLEQVTYLEVANN